MSLLPFLVLWLVTVIPLNAANEFDGSCQCFDKEYCEASEENDVCYFLYTDKQRTWDESKALCKSKNLTMAQLNKETPLKQITAQIWLGGRSKNLEKWTFVNNVSLEKAKANPHRTLENGDDHNQCGVLTYTKTDNRHIEMETNKDNCYKPHHFICRWGKWNNFNSFYISESSTDWYNARIRCKEFGGDLMYLDPMESIAILNKKLPISRNKTMFIGLTKKIWQWEGGNEIWPINWPTVGNSNFKEQCLSLNEKGMKGAKDCNAKLYAFCSTGRTSNNRDDARHLKAEKIGRALHHDRKITVLLSCLLGISWLVIIIGVIFIVYYIKTRRKSKVRNTGGVFNLDDMINRLGRQSVSSLNSINGRPNLQRAQNSPDDYINTIHRYGETGGEYSASWRRSYPTPASYLNSEQSDGYAGNREYFTIVDHGGEMDDRPESQNYQNM